MKAGTVCGSLSTVSSNSPLDLGVLQLDRTPPSLSSVLLTPEGGTVVADWIQSDALSGTDPAQPVVVEVNADPGGGAGGDWVPFAQQPEPGDGRKVARTSLAGLPDGRHLVRARTRDRAGNAAEPVLGTVLADHTPPVVTDVHVASQAAGPTGIAEIAYTAVNPSPGYRPRGRPAASGRARGERRGLDRAGRLGARAGRGAAAEHRAPRRHRAGERPPRQRRGERAHHGPAADGGPGGRQANGAGALAGAVRGRGARGGRRVGAASRFAASTPGAGCG